MSRGAERLGSALIDPLGKPGRHNFIRDQSNHLPLEATDIEDFQPICVSDPSVEADSMLRSPGSIRFSSNGHKSKILATSLVA